MGMVALLFTTRPMPARATWIVVAMKTICDEFESLGYRRVCTPNYAIVAIVVNAKKIRRLNAQSMGR